MDGRVSIVECKCKICLKIIEKLSSTSNQVEKVAFAMKKIWICERLKKQFIRQWKTFIIKSGCNYLIHCLERAESPQLESMVTGCHTQKKRKV